MNFFSDISLFWLFPLALVCFGVAFWYYKTQNQLKELTKRLRFILTTLRGSALFLLGLLLFGIVFELKESKIEKPIFILLTDNSTSLLNYADSVKVLSSINKTHKELKEEFANRFEFRDYTIGEKINLNSVTLDELESNLSDGFEFIYNEFYNRNIGAICFTSDGNFNKGFAPTYSAEKINLTPIFTIGVGDTIVKRDQLLRNISVNDIAFYKNEFPIEVNIEGHKMGKINTEISLWKGKEKIDSKIINYKDGDLDFINVNFMVNANEIGFVNYTVRLKQESKESSYQNNSRTLYVEIIDSRSKVLIVADAPHPDISAIKQELDKDENMEVSTVLVDEWDGDLSNFSLVIWHNPKEKGISLFNEINNNKVPVLYLLGINSSRSFLSKMNIGVNLTESRSTDDVQATFTDEFQLFEVSDKLKKSIKKWQPLTVPFGNIRQRGGDVLINQQVGGIIKNTPIMVFNLNENGKTGILIGEGLWRWKLSENIHSGNNILFNELIQKTVQYLTVKENLEPLRVNLPRRLTTRDKVILNAEFYNSSFEPITSPEIKFNLIYNDNISTEHTFTKHYDYYSLDLGLLNEGVYSWFATTEYSGRNYVKKGSFIIDKTSIEDLSTHANHNILEQISSKSNGRFYQLNSSKEIFDDIHERKDIANVSYQESNFTDLIDWKILLFSIFFLLAFEWFIRRYFGTY